MYSLCSLCAGYYWCCVPLEKKAEILLEPECCNNSLNGFVLVRGFSLIKRRMEREGYQVMTIDGKTLVKR